MRRRGADVDGIGIGEWGREVVGHEVMISFISGEIHLSNESSVRAGFLHYRYVDLSTGNPR